MICWIALRTVPAEHVEPVVLLRGWLAAVVAVLAAVLVVSLAIVSLAVVALVSFPLTVVVLVVVLAVVALVVVSLVLVVSLLVALVAVALVVLPLVAVALVVVLLVFVAALAGPISSVVAGSAGRAAIGLVGVAVVRGLFLAALGAVATVPRTAGCGRRYATGCARGGRVGIAAGRGKDGH